MGFPGCSGTVVAPTIVLTAAHCVADTRPAGVGISVRIDDRIFVPRSAEIDPAYRADLHLHDLAILHFDESLPSAIATLSDTPPDAGEAVLLSGIGRTDDGSHLDPSAVPPLHQGTARIAEVASAWVRLEPGPSLSCDGDSGGPVSVTRGARLDVIAVVTAGDADCTTLSIASRVDQNAWLHARLGEAEGSHEEGGCNVSAKPAAHCNEAPLVILLAAVLTWTVRRVRSRRATGEGASRRRRPR
jgi:Trypsin